MKIPLVQQYFDSEWLNEVATIYKANIVKNIGSFDNPGFFSAPGSYRHSNDGYRGNVPQHHAERSMYGASACLNHLIYFPGINVLEYVIINSLKDICVLDWGAGTGTLSIFLAKLGIRCINYDNLSQITGNARLDGHKYTMQFIKAINDRFGYNIEYITTEPESLDQKQIDIITACGVPIKRFPQGMNIKYLLLDKFLEYPPLQEYAEIEEMNMIKIYKHIGA